MNDRELIEEIGLRPALFGLTCSYSQSVAFLLGLDLGRSGGLLRGFDEWLIVRRGSDTSLRWTALVLEVAFPDSDLRRADDLSAGQNEQAHTVLFSLLNEFLGVQESGTRLARMYAAYEILCS